MHACIENMVYQKKIGKKKIILLAIYMVIFILCMYSQYIFYKMNSFPVVIENEYGNILYKNHYIQEKGKFLSFILPSLEDNDIWMQINKGKYKKINSNRITIRMERVKEYNKEIYISFLAKNKVSGELLKQNYIFVALNSDKERECIENKQK